MAFIINNSGLIAAAKAMSEAREAYEREMASLKTELNNVTDSWKDEASEDWAGLVPETITDLDKISTNLGYNNDLMRDVADKASQLQGTIKSEIKKLYLN